VPAAAPAAGPLAAAAEGCVPVLGATLPPFEQHVRFAHLEPSLEDQVEDVQDVARYARTHAVLIEAMAAPAMGALGGCAGVPAPQVPGPAPVPEPMPGHTPAQPAPAPDAAPAPARAMEVGVMMMGNAYAPGSLQVAPGGTVAWTNMDAVPHTVTGGPLQSSALNQGGVFSYRFDTPGTFAYYCAIHPDMKGAVVVRG
jgi:plastocyanin